MSLFLIEKFFLRFWENKNWEFLFFLEYFFFYENWNKFDEYFKYGKVKDEFNLIMRLRYTEVL